MVFAAPPVIDAARVRENWFLAIFILGVRCQSGRRPATGKFCRFVGPFGGGVGSGSQGRNLRKNGLGYPRPGRRATIAGQCSSVPRALSRRRSIPQHILVIRGGVHVVTGFVGIRPWATRWRGAGGWVVPGAGVAKNLLDHARVVNHRDNAHRVRAEGAARGVSRPDPVDEVAPPLGGQFKWRRRRKARAGARPTPAPAPGGGRRASCCRTSRSSGAPQILA